MDEFGIRKSEKYIYVTTEEQNLQNTRTECSEQQVVDWFQGFSALKGLRGFI